MMAIITKIIVITMHFFFRALDYNNITTFINYFTMQQHLCKKLCRYLSIKSF